MNESQPVDQEINIKALHTLTFLVTAARAFKSCLFKKQKVSLQFSFYIYCTH